MCERTIGFEVNIARHNQAMLTLLPRNKAKGLVVKVLAEAAQADIGCALCKEIEVL